MAYLSVGCRRCGGVGLHFFFQAEDGIRDLVRSRGLGDVYKRQTSIVVMAPPGTSDGGSFASALRPGRPDAKLSSEAVSYTHLTLPTSDLV